ncbi:hypothetical protein [Nocardia sp. NPDC050710]|uniref:hypothetical protein n=1 Tax=Nocardia sp. NPDC050710 TaxID=3157220 RepID=UPI0033FD06AE
MARENPAPSSASSQWETRSAADAKPSQEDQVASGFRFDKFLDELGQFYGFTQAMSGLIQEAFSAGPPHISARDTTGAVEVTVATTGELVDIFVSDNWRHRVGEDGVGSAVVNAIKKAEQMRVESTSIAASRNGVLDRISTLSIDDAVPIKITRPQPAASSAVDIDGLIERVMQTLDRSPEEANVGEFIGTSVADGGIQASVTLTRSGIADCIVQIPWGTDTRGDSIAWAVKHAHAAARETILTSPAAGLGDSSGLFSELIQVINSLQSPKG